ncbi:MAG: PQQ-binding-like beta-propeller repeat protein [Alphaproteobacteria bacterium]|nr:PQQ-binding-like beta-propeller repeat protein [Alphaproteobacteria bacterium]
MRPDHMTVRAPRAFRARWCVFLPLLLALGACSTVSGIFGGRDDEKKDTIGGQRISILELEQRLEVDPRIADVEVRLPPPATLAAWSQPGGTPDHAMRHIALGDTLSRVWRANAGAGSTRRTRIMAPPIIAGGRVYVLDAESTVRAFSSETGDRLWEVELTPEDERAAAGFGGGIAFMDGRLYAVTGFGTALAIDAETGAIAWTKTLGTPFRTAPTAVGGRVFATSYDNRLVGLDAADGTLIWSYRGIEEPAGVLASSSPAVSGEIVIAPFSSGELTALRADNGRMAWTDSLTRTGRLTAMSALNDIAGSPVISAGRVYAVSHSGRLISVDLRIGERVWTRNIASVETPWVAGDFLYIVTLDAQLVCLSARDGRVRWITQLPRWEDEDDEEDAIAWSGPVLAGGRLWLTSSDERLVAASPNDGGILSEIELSAPSYIRPAVANDTLFLLLDDGTLEAYR